MRHSFQTTFRFACVSLGFVFFCWFVRLWCCAIRGTHMGISELAALTTTDLAYKLKTKSFEEDAREIQSYSSYYEA